MTWFIKLVGVLLWVGGFIFCQQEAEELKVDNGVNVQFPADSYQTRGLQTYLSFYPPSLTNSQEARFEFFCNKPACRFKCKLDYNSWTSCKSPKIYLNLADGTHFFKVKAISQSGAIDPTPAKYRWTIDTIPPDTILNSYPANPSGQTFGVFEFESNEGGSSFECKLDFEDWEPACVSPKNYSGLSPGAHLFSVRAIDLAGNVDPSPASYAWTIETSATCVDADQDGYGEHCGNGTDCDDSDPDNFSKCSTCQDADQDGWFAGCDRYEHRLGPDCDDEDYMKWKCCDCCPKDCYYAGSCVCPAEWNPVCVAGFRGDCYESNECWANVYCEPVLCALPIDEFGEIDQGSQCAQQHPGCLNQCY